MKGTAIKTRILGVPVSPAIADLVDDFRKDQGVSAAEVIRHALMTSIARHYLEVMNSPKLKKLPKEDSWDAVSLGLTPEQKEELAPYILKAK